MTFSGLSVPGQRAGAGNRQANYSAIISQKVLDDFSRMCWIKDRHTVLQAVAGSKSHTVTSRGLATAKTRLQSEFMNFRQPTAREFGAQTILLENEKYSMTAISDWDRVQREPQYRDDLASDTAYTLARQWDGACCIKIMQGALTDESGLGPAFKGGASVSLPTSPPPSGSGARVPTTKSNVTGPQLVKAAVQLSSTFDEADVPNDNPRYLGVIPTDYGKMVVDKSATVQNPLDTRIGGRGSIADGELMRVGNMAVLPMTVLKALRINILATNADWGTANTTGNQPWLNSMVGDYSKVVAIGWNKEAVATAIWEPIAAGVHMQKSVAGGNSFLAAWGAGFAIATFYFGTQRYRESCAGVILESS